MNELRRKFLILIAIAGLIISGYLAYLYAVQVPIPCSTDGGCDIVRESDYAQFFGIPTPWYGIVFYLSLLGLVEFWDGEIRGRLFLMLKLLTLSGLLVSLFLTYLEAFVVLAWCSWCVGSALLSLSAFVLVWFVGGRRDFD